MTRARVALLIAGLLGLLAVFTGDMVMGKPVNDFTGPVSTPAMVISAILVVAGSSPLWTRHKARPRDRVPPCSCKK